MLDAEETVKGEVTFPCHIDWIVIYKLALITLAAVLGYWLDRSLFPKARPGQYLKHDDRLMAEGRFPVQTGLHLVFSAALIRRALIVAAVCLAVAMGL